MAGQPACACEGVACSIIKASCREVIVGHGALVAARREPVPLENAQWLARARHLGAPGNYSNAASICDGIFISNLDERHFKKRDAKASPAASGADGAK